MGDILFLAHRVPFPPDRGDKIRSHHLLHRLAQMARVHVGCFGETDADMACEKALGDIAANHLLLRRSKPLFLAGFEALTSGRPVSLTAFASRAMHDWVAHTLHAHHIDTIVIFSGQMGQYVPHGFAGRCVIDLCDVDSAKFEAYGREGAGPRAMIHRREGRLLAAEEARLARLADAVLLATDDEAALFRSRIEQANHDKVHTLRNGIDAAAFDPAAVDASTPFSDGPGPHLVFTGQMDYPPNIAAVTRAAHAILPGVSDAHPGAQLHIMGRAPTAAVKRLSDIAGVQVWGAVPDMRPFLAHADCVIAPLRIARGIQNKVLEAMAMARPVVLSPEAATGIDATDGAHFAVAPDDAAFVTAINTLLANGGAAKTMGQAARQYLCEQQSWDAMLAPLAALIGRDEADGLRDVA